MVHSALGMALLAVAAQISIPIGLVPVTMQSLVVFVILMVFAPSVGMLTIGGYLLLGAVGLPVGAGLRGGLAWLVGPTGGFLIGFMLAAVAVASVRSLADPKIKTTWQQSMLDVTVGLVTMTAYYGCGVGWLMWATKTNLSAALSVAVIPFLLPDLLKLAAAVSCAKTLRRAVTRLSPYQGSV